MFRHALVPVDGTALSKTAIATALQLARSVAGKVTFFHVALPRDFSPYGGYAYGLALPVQHLDEVKSSAHRHLAAAEALAVKAGVACAAHYIVSESPSHAILRAAKKYRCDGIVMATNARSGLERWLLGSETQKVLAGTRLPVMVLRAKGGSTKRPTARDTAS